MKRVALVLVLLAALPLAASADVSKDDIRKLVKNGISDSVIVAYIRANRPVRHLSSDDVIELKNMGASDAVLEALLDGASKKAAPAPAVQPQPAPRVVEKPVYVQTPVYVQRPMYHYVTTDYYYHPRPYYTNHYSYSWPAYRYHRPYYGYGGYRYGGHHYYSRPSGWVGYSRHSRNRSWGVSFRW
ncbi:MAG: hypothetical protein ACYTAF_12130 [Planctomycetota bacterium]|jgi:hypothetical protein